MKINSSKEIAAQSSRLADVEMNHDDIFASLKIQSRNDLHEYIRK